MFCHFLQELPNKIIDITKDVGRFLKDKVLDKVVDLHKGMFDLRREGRFFPHV